MVIKVCLERRTSWIQFAVENIKCTILWTWFIHNLFFVNCEESSLVYMNHSRHLIPDGINRNECMREEARVPNLPSAKHSWGQLVPFVKSLVWTSRWLNQLPPTLEADSLSQGYRVGSIVNLDNKYYVTFSCILEKPQRVHHSNYFEFYFIYR